MSFLKKATPKSGKGNDSDGRIDPAFVKAYPALAEHLSVGRYSDGQSRETSTITLFFQDGSFKAVLSDRDNRRSLFCTARVFSGLLAALEEHCKDEEPDWREWRQGKGGRK